MESFKLSQAAKWTNGQISDDTEILSVSKDSREIPDSCLFLAIKGENFDGHDYINKAIENGAKAILSHRKDEKYSVPTLYVEDTRQAILDLAEGYKKQFDCPLVAITGSVGKTTTRGLTASVVSQKYNTHATKGNLNNQLGMPLTLLELNHTYEAAVIEMGMSGFGEILSMAKCAKPDIAVITNIGTAHIEFLGSREGICKAKMEILDGLYERSGTAVLNGDEPLLWNKRDEIKADVIWFGMENPECDVKAENIILKSDSVGFTIVYKDIKTPVKLSIAGVHNVSNALAAAAVGFKLGISPEKIAQGIFEYTPDGRRQKLYEKNGFIIYEDCYNASPDSMKAALAVLSSQKKGTKFAVLGSMLELGDYTEQGHIETGENAAKNADKLYLYGDYAKFMAEGAKKGGMSESNIHVFSTHEKLADSLKKDAKEGDVLLFKGSRSMKMEQALGLFLGEEV